VGEGRYTPVEVSGITKDSNPQIPTDSEAGWKAWIAETYGSMADAPIERGEQGDYETRETLEPSSSSLP
jgi:hypothetical protein